MNVILYTINDTESDFCKQAKDFLNAHNIPFENKDVEHDRTALSAMLAVSDNFSGVPVMVVGEGTDQKVVKGFTPQEFEQALGLSPQAEAIVATPSVQDSVPAPVMPPVETLTPAEPVTAPVEPVADLEPAAPVEPLAPPVEPSAPAWNNEPIAPAAPVEPVTAAVEPAHDEALKGIMDTLSQNGMPSTPAVAQPTPPLEIPVEDHPVNPISAPTEFSAPAAPAEPAAPAVTEPSTWVNQPVSAPVAPPAQAWNNEPATTPSQPAAPVADMPSVPDFPQK